MEQHERLLRDAINYFKTADHLTYVTYSLLKDQKLMLPIVNNLYSASVSAIAALLHHEKIYKRVDAFPLDIDSRIRLFEDVAKNKKINSNIVKAVKELRYIIKEQKDSPLEFARKEKLIICNNDYSSINVIDINKIKGYTTNVRELLKIVSNIKDV